MLSVTILTKNSEQQIGNALESVRWSDDVVVLDNGSSDRTLEIAATFHNVRVHRTRFCGFGALKNEAAALARHDWILSLDSDEVVSETLTEELRNIGHDRRSVYELPRHNYYNGKWIRWAGWHPDSLVRVYNRTATRYSDDQIHEKVLTRGVRIRRLRGCLKHYPYGGLRDFVEKMQLYSDLFAEQHAGSRRAPLLRCLWKGFFAFFRSYLIWGGILAGCEGLIISAFNSQLTYYKYMKLREANLRRKKRLDGRPNLSDSHLL